MPNTWNIFYLTAILVFFNGELWWNTVLNCSIFQISRFLFKFSYRIGINSQGVLEPACCGDFVLGQSNGCRLYSCHNIAVPYSWCPDDLYNICICKPDSGLAFDECTHKCIPYETCQPAKQLEKCINQTNIDLNQSRCDIEV